MARQNFNAVMDVIFRHEGGYVNHPRDPGGATNMGITKRTLENHLGRDVSIEEVKALSKATARDIYRKSYWNVIKGDDLPAGLDLVAMDAREAFLRGLPTWGTFGKGWSRRLKETREEAHRMFDASGTVPGTVPTQPTGGGFFAALAALFKAIFGGRK